jgi:peroxiredoxin
LAELRTLLAPDEKVSLLAISIDDASISKTFTEKIAADGKGAINFPVLSDPMHKTIDAYGVYDPAYAGQKFDGIPHPAVFILDKNRKIVWAKVEPDYRKRPTNAEIRTELDKLK